MPGFALGLRSGHISGCTDTFAGGQRPQVEPVKHTSHCTASVPVVQGARQQGIRTRSSSSSSPDVSSSSPSLTSRAWAWAGATQADCQDGAKRKRTRDTQRERGEDHRRSFGLRACLYVLNGVDLLVIGLDQLVKRTAIHRSGEGPAAQVQTTCV